MIRRLADILCLLASSGEYIVYRDGMDQRI